jgi:hypothetical protein
MPHSGPLALRIYVRLSVKDIHNVDQVEVQLGALTAADRE